MVGIIKVYDVHHTKEPLMTTDRTYARIAGVLYFVTHVTSIAAVLLYGGSAFGADVPLAGRGPVLLGGLLEIVLALAVVGTGIALFPLVRRASHAVAAGYLALRTLEASVILVGVVVLLPVVARPHTTATPGLSADVIDGLRLIHDWTFLIGPGLIVPIHTVLLAWLLWRAQLTPRFIPMLGFIGGPLIGMANLVVMFGVTKVVPVGTLPVVALPVFAWEISLAAYLVIRGLRARPQPSSANPVD